MCTEWSNGIGSSSRKRRCRRSGAFVHRALAWRIRVQIGRRWVRSKHHRILQQRPHGMMDQDSLQNWCLWRYRRLERPLAGSTTFCYLRLPRADRSTAPLYPRPWDSARGNPPLFPEDHRAVIVPRRLLSCCRRPQRLHLPPSPLGACFLVVIILHHLTTSPFCILPIARIICPFYHIGDVVVYSTYIRP